MRRTSRVLIACGMVSTLLFGARADDASVRPFPEIDTVIRGMVERAKLDAKFDRELETHYRFTHTKVHEERNLKGVLRKREAERTVHEPAPVTGESRTWQSDAAARLAAAPGQGAKGDKADRPYDENDITLTEPLVRRFDFQFLGRECVAGRTALKMSFHPAARELPAKGLVDRFINHTAGTIWVDEGDFTIARADFWLTQKLTFGAGILGSVSSFNCRFERERTDEGVWYTRNVEWHVECREFLVNKRIEQKETREDLVRVR